MPRNIAVSEIMTKGIFSVTPEDTVKRADEIMREEKIRHLPVLDGKKFLGMITDRSIHEYTLRRLYDYDDNIEEAGLAKIKDFGKIVNADMKYLFPEDTLVKATELMAKYKYDCLPVLDWDHNLVGILSSIDVMLYFHERLS